MENSDATLVSSMGKTGNGQKNRNTHTRSRREGRKVHSPSSHVTCHPTQDSHAIFMFSPLPRSPPLRRTKSATAATKAKVPNARLSPSSTVHAHIRLQTPRNGKSDSRSGRRPHSYCVRNTCVRVRCDDSGPEKGGGGE